MNIVKKAVYFIPALLMTFFYGLLILYADALEYVSPFAFVILIMLYLSGISFFLNRYQGFIFGFLVGIIFIVMGFRETGQLIKEWPLGILLCLFYSICGYRIYKRLK